MPRSIGVGPTPYLYFAVHHLNADGGVQITGSHNPGDENGFKMMKGKASFFGADIQTLREKIQKKDFGEEKKGSVTEQDLQDAYVAAMKERFDFSKSPASARCRPSASRPTRSSARWTDASRTTIPIRRCRRTSRRSSPG